jgi:hypothetical protein
MLTLNLYVCSTAASGAGAELPASAIVLVFWFLDSVCGGFEVDADDAIGGSRVWEARLLVYGR